MITTSPQFEVCLPFVLKEEGGYSNTPGDHGGATNFGTKLLQNVLGVDIDGVWGPSVMRG